MFDKSVQRKKTMQKSHKIMKLNMIMCLAASTAVIATEDPSQQLRDTVVRTSRGRWTSRGRLDNIAKRFNAIKRRYINLAYTGFDDNLKEEDFFNINGIQFNDLAKQLCFNLTFREPNADIVQTNGEAGYNALLQECGSCLERLGYGDNCFEDIL